MPLKKSMHICDVGYDITDGRLEVTLKSGRRFCYVGVREEFCHMLIRSGKLKVLGYIANYYQTDYPPHSRRRRR